jgi:uncharacterized membrane protein
MAKLEKSIFIDAPVEKVFGFMAEPYNILEIWPSMQEIKNLEALPNGGHSYDWAYKMAGLRFEGHTETTELVRNQRVVAKNEGGIPSTFVWIYRVEDGGTRVTMSVDYEMPGKLLGKLAEPIVHKMNEHEGDILLANLKARMEG